MDALEFLDIALNRIESFPCRIDAMTARELAIAKITMDAVASMQNLRNILEKQKGQTLCQPS